MKFYKKSKLFLDNISTLLGVYLNQNIQTLKNKYLNQRCFIMGNGPSLKKMDLTKLTNEHTFVSNMFHLHPQCLEIKPSFYTISDWIHWHNDNFIDSMVETFPKLNSTKFFFEKRAKPIYKKSFSQKPLNEVHFIQLNDEEYVWEDKFTTNVENSLNWARSVVLDFSIPLAIYMGFKEIILIGCDFNHCDNLKKKKNLWFYENDKPIEYTHAHLTLMNDPEHLKKTMDCLDIIKEHTDNNGIKLLNATLGGNIQNLPRVNYDDLF